MKVVIDNRPATRFHFPLRITCNRCKSELEAAAGDVKTAQGSEMAGTNGHFYVECPLCHAHNTVKPNPPKTSAQLTEDYYNK